MPGIGRSLGVALGWIGRIRKFRFFLNLNEAYAPAFSGDRQPVILATWDPFPPMPRVWESLKVPFIIPTKRPSSISSGSVK